MHSLELVLPGDLRTATGGYVYDRRIVEGLREIGWRVAVHTLHSSFPHPTANALEHARRTFAEISDGARVLIDGLALGAMPEVVEPHSERLRLIALIHHPLAAETGLGRDTARALEESERRALRTVRQVIVTSRATREALEAYGVAPERIAVVEPGTDPAPSSHKRSDGALRMLCVATITPRKGHDVLVEALAALRQYDWKLDCIGSTTRSTSTVERLQSALGQTGLSERVTLAGEADEATLSAYYAEADLFVLPTRFEGYGMAVAEALAHGLPVVSTTTGAIPEIVPPSAGVLVPPGDADALKQALEQLMKESHQLEELAAGARRARESLPCWAESVMRMSHILEGV